MKKYLFKTTTTMKDYNRKKWWIARDCISDKCIVAENLKDALQEYRNKVKEKDYITISDNAMKTRSPMYDSSSSGTKQVGFVITGQADFESSGKWVTQYIDLWVQILTIVDTEF